MQKDNYNLFLSQKSSMNEDLYLQRLRSIREKYTSTNKYPMEVKNADFAYRPYPANPQSSIPKQRIIQATPTRPKPAQFQLTRTPLTRVERSYSLADQNPVIPVPDIGARDVSQKRMENFSSFIRDLDQRIQEKERALNSKIKASETPLKPKEDPEYEVARTLNRYSSSKEIYRPNVPPISQSVSRVAPRDAYERSLAKRDQIQSRRGLSNHDIENMLDRKWTQDGAVGQKLKLMSSYRDVKLKINQYASPLGISNNDNLLSQDSWSIGKLDNIQKRIKAVLG